MSLLRRNQHYHEINEAVCEKDYSVECSLFIVVLIYIFLGAFIVSAYEPEMDVYDALYFNFITLTTIGLGVNIWFGGKKLTLKQLIKNLSDQLNLNSDVLDQLDLDSFVENAIKVEAGELPSLRNMHIKPKRPIVATDFKDVFSEDQIMFIDEDELAIVYTFKKTMDP
uniref:Potassium channel domain-containing protein n=1 Tax=Acrobeloides nanus TaxID=290746 RepID=A0A914CSE7_9BILA